jgi:hypothetical protein
MSSDYVITSKSAELVSAADRLRKAMRAREAWESIRSPAIVAKGKTLYVVRRESVSGRN